MKKRRATGPQLHIGEPPTPRFVEDPLKPLRPRKCTPVLRGNTTFGFQLDSLPEVLSFQPTIGPHAAHPKQNTYTTTNTNKSQKFKRESSNGERQASGQEGVIFFPELTNVIKETRKKYM